MLPGRRATIAPIALCTFLCACGNATSSSGADGGSENLPDAGAEPGADASGHDGGTVTGELWQPEPGTTWQWQLTGTIDTSVDVAMYDVDLFDTPQEIIDELRGQGRVVVCYFSAGSSETWRPDAADIPAGAVGNELDGWPGERWLDTRSDGVRAVMQARLDLAVAKECDGVEPDNVDGYANDPGFPLSAATQVDYNRFLAAEAHARGLSIGLKNALELVPELEGDFDWALNEECFVYGECEALTPFVDAGKAVFHVEYGDASLADTVCPVTDELGLSTLIKNLDLDAWRAPCP